jgi:malate dehydrogenase (oxaloacetate-decarboxylating)(NADP+)
MEFGKEYFIPKPFDPRLITEIPIAVAKAAMASGVAERPISDFVAYRQQLETYIDQTSMIMRPIFGLAQKHKNKVIYADAEEQHILQAAQIVADEGLAHPVLVGRRHVVETRLKRLRLRMQEGKDFTLVDPENDSRFGEYWQAYHRLLERRGMNEATAKTIMRTNTTVIGAMLLNNGEGDALICGAVGNYHRHLAHCIDVIGLRDGVSSPAAMSLLLLDRGNFFILDTYVNTDPNAQAIADMTSLAAEEIRRFGIEPKVALLSHSNFGSHTIGP